MIGQERAALGPPALHGPSARHTLELEATHEDLVDAFQGFRETGQHVALGC